MRGVPEVRRTNPMGKDRTAGIEKVAGVTRGYHRTMTGPPTQSADRVVILAAFLAILASYAWLLESTQNPNTRTRVFSTFALPE